MNIVKLEDIDCRALAMLCKRSFFERVRAFASSDQEAWEMEDALLRLKKELERNGFSPR